MGESTVACTRKPILAGIFTIICGAIEIWGSLRCLVNPWSMGDIYVGIAVYMIGLIAIMGGILALGRRVWWLALTGAICAIAACMVAPWMLTKGPPLPPGFEYSPIWVWVMILGIPLSILGISAIVLTVLSKEEFI